MVLCNIELICIVCELKRELEAFTTTTPFFQRSVKDLAAAKKNGSNLDLDLPLDVRRLEVLQVEPSPRRDVERRLPHQRAQRPPRHDHPVDQRRRQHRRPGVNIMITIYFCKLLAQKALFLKTFF
jgi:hypothetical protein